VGTMAITEEQRERIEILAAINATRRAYANMFKDANMPNTPAARPQQVTLTNPRICNELGQRVAEQRVTYSQLVEHILWNAFFPGESKDQKPVKLVKACPNCGSRNLIEPKNRFPLQCECLDCKVAFEQPTWRVM